MSDIDISEPLSDLLAPLNNEQREFLMNNYTIQTYKKNETIYCEGETPSHLMCLITGKVKIFKDGVGGRSQIIRMIKQREYFAYRAYFAKEDFVTAAAAFEPSVICLIPMTAITTLIAQNNDLAMFFIRQLSIDLGISDERTVSYASHGNYLKIGVIPEMLTEPAYMYFNSVWVSLGVISPYVVHYLLTGEYLSGV